MILDLVVNCTCTHLFGMLTPGLASLIISAICQCTAIMDHRVSSLPVHRKVYSLWCSGSMRHLYIIFRFDVRLYAIARDHFISIYNDTCWNFIDECIEFKLARPMKLILQAMCVVTKCLVACSQEWCSQWHYWEHLPYSKFRDGLEMFSLLPALCETNPSVLGGLSKTDGQQCGTWIIFVAVSVIKPLDKLPESSMIWVALALMWSHCNACITWSIPMVLVCFDLLGLDGKQ